MTALSFVTRLIRDLVVKSPHDLTADSRLEILDCINGAIQRLDVISGAKAKTTLAGFFLEAPAAVSVGVTNGSADVTVATFSSDQYGRTIRIEGDDIDNQIVSATSLLHPYTGSTGTVSATIYADSIPMPDPYLEILTAPRILGYREPLGQHDYQPRYGTKRDIGRPLAYWVEANARNRNPTARAFIRFHPMPEQIYRLEAQVTLAPLRITFADLLAPGESLPVRTEWVENYLLPIARKLLAESSEIWRDVKTKSTAITAGESAESRFSKLSPITFATPTNEVGTPYGF